MVLMLNYVICILCFRSIAERTLKTHLGQYVNGHGNGACAELAISSSVLITSVTD